MNSNVISIKATKKIPYSTHAIVAMRRVFPLEVKSMRKELCYITLQSIQ